MVFFVCLFFFLECSYCIISAILESRPEFLLYGTFMRCWNKKRNYFQTGKCLKKVKQQKLGIQFADSGRDLCLILCSQVIGNGVVICN